MTLPVYRVLGVLRVLTVALATAGLAGGAQAAAPPRGVPEHFTALSIDTTVGLPSIWLVELVVTHWSSEDESDMLMGTLFDRGPEALFDELRECRPVGFLRTAGGPERGLRFALAIADDDGGRSILLVADGPAGSSDPCRQPRSPEYAFTIIELHLNAEGDGDGTMRLATRVWRDPETGIVTLEDCELQPLRLLSVRADRPTTY